MNEFQKLLFEVLPKLPLEITTLKTAIETIKHDIESLGELVTTTINDYKEQLHDEATQLAKGYVDFYKNESRYTHERLTRLGAYLMNKKKDPVIAQILFGDDIKCKGVTKESSKRTKKH